MRAAVVLVLLVVAPMGGTAAQQPPTPFQQEAMAAIYAVIPQQAGRFVLARPRTSPLAIYYEGAGAQPIECQRNVLFDINAGQAESGAISVSVCPEHVARLRSLAATGARASGEAIADLQAGMPPWSVDQVRVVGLYRERSTTPSGAELHYFPLIAVGHGVAIVPTVILLTSTQAVVAQGGGMALCNRADNPVPLCADPKGTLSAIAQRLLK